MAVMRSAGTGHRPPGRANARDDGDEYVIELDVSDFLESELAVDVVGLRVTVRGDQAQEPHDDDDGALRLHERLEESFRLPDDADADAMKVFHVHGALEIHVPHTTLGPRRVPIEHRSPFAGNPDAGPC